MAGLKAMFLDDEPDKNIRCRFTCDCFKIESYVRSNARLFLEIEKTNPTSIRNGVLIFTPWQPLGYGLFFSFFLLYTF